MSKPRRPGVPIAGVAAGIAAILLFAACATRDVGYPAENFVSPPTGPNSWTTLAEGIRWGSLVHTDPPVRAWVVEIDLTTPGLEVFVTPGEPSMDRDTIGRKTSETVREFDLQLAINGGPYHPYARQAGTPQDIIGLAVSDGTLYSDPEPGYAALLFRKGYSATVSPGPVHDLDAVVQGLGGFGPLLRGGENLGSKGPREPRTAVGIGKDGKLLYLFAADGRQPRWSVGLTTEETADWLRALGAVEAINLDGGGSTTLALRGPRGFVKVVNRPVDYYLIGNERVVANHLGFRAPPVGGEGP